MIKLLHAVHRILLYVPHRDIAGKLLESLASQGYSAAAVADHEEFLTSLRQDHYDVVVTGTRHVREVRAGGHHPIINYEVFIHRHQSGEPRTYFHMDDFINRIRFYTGAAV